jgi:hypothetical protein
MLVLFSGLDHMLRKVRKSRYAAFNGAGPGAPGSSPDLPRCRANRAMPPLLIPARAPTRHPLCNEPEIALRDPHGLAVCGRIRSAIPPGMPMRHTHTKALLPALPGFAPPPAYRAGTLGPDARRTPAGPPPDACRTPAGRNGTGLSLGQNALESGFHSVPTGPAHPDRDADGAGVT